MISTPSYQVDVTCANCNSTGLTVFYNLEQVPVHSVMLHSSLQEAMEFPKGDVRLGYCSVCGFIMNVSFDPNIQNYFTQNYDATQSFSDTFNAFHRDLAMRLINQYDLQNKSIIEIGCGQGEFLDLLCTLGGNTGIGFDPAYVEGKWIGSAKDRITFIKDYYTEENSRQYKADFVCCKMTLEHIHNPYQFVNMLSHSVRNQFDTVVFFQVPNAQYVLQETAFWDIYYEHCSYFTQASLRYLFQLCGFQIIGNSLGYDDQYLMIEAKLAQSVDKQIRLQQNELSKLRSEIATFQMKYAEIVSMWKNRIDKLSSSGKKIVLWSGGSKAVAFLTTLNIRDEIEYVVDINPHKQGMYLAGTGQKIVNPKFLAEYRPDVVILMNPVYTEEVKDILKKMGVIVNLTSL